MYYSTSYMSLSILLALSLWSCAEGRLDRTPGAPSSLNTDCSCGFYDSVSGDLFTESMIVYFNETTSFPNQVFSVSDYTHQYEKSFNTIYRIGTSSTNVRLGNNSDAEVSSGSSLELYIDPASKQHLVVGGEIKSTRQDMQYGSFSALVKGPPRSSYGGSALSMEFRFNETQRWDMDLLNTDHPGTAWLATLVGGEFPDRKLGVNYSTLADTSSSNYTSSPWEFVEWKVDWNEKSINYSIGGVLARSVTRKQGSIVPSVPGSLMFKHWSNGNKYKSQGPPSVRSLAQVGWIRSFFNSSTTTNSARAHFDATCDISTACLVSDMSIRGSTSYDSAATVPWEQKEANVKLKIFAIIIITVGTLVGILVVFNATIRRLVARRRTARRSKEDASSSNTSTLYAGSFSGSLSDVGGNSVRAIHSSASSTVAFSSGANTAVGTGVHTSAASRASSVTGSSSSAASIAKSAMQFYPLALQADKQEGPDSVPSHINDSVRNGFGNDRATANHGKGQVQDSKNIEATVTAAPGGPNTVILQGGKPRIDYMAGIVAICSLMVTLIHFCLTFLPALQTGYNDHYRSEVWAHRILSPYFLNAAWLGLFFTTSTRFLTAGYLESGNLKNIGQKTVTRSFRLIIPVAGVVILEYFLIDCGATNWLEYLPSVTWSTWPYTVRYRNFGEFLNEVLELLYLIPNSAPQITFNFCTGVLWTIPVTLQGSWISLLGVIIVYQIKNPWKRSGYYAICILTNWYAREWGSFFWAGLLLTDLDITYKYRKWIEAKPIFHWMLFISCLLIAFAMLSWDALLVDADIPLLKLERSIHPDLTTGRPIAQTANSQYPAYFEPRLNGLIFSVALQLAIEISPLLQKLLSSRILMWVFPHIFTIYLFHGFIFWSIGASIVVHLSSIGVPYWANMLVTAVSCWGTLFLSVKLLTPAVESLGMHITAVIWRHAQEGSVKKEATLWPFEKDLLLGR